MKRTAAAHSVGSAVALIFGCSLLGCSDDDLEGPCPYNVCRYDSELCILQTATTLACHMNTEVRKPEVRFATRDEIVAERRQDSDTLDFEQQELDRDIREALSFLGFWPPDYDPSDLAADSLRNVAAFYDSDTQAITVISDSEPPPLDEAYTLLIHELVHAYQDSLYGLHNYFERYATTFDRALASRALIEGEATFHQSKAYFSINELDFGRADWDAYQRSMLEAANNSDTPELDAWRLFPYAWGGELVYDASRDGDAVAALYQRPPDSVRQLFGGYDAWRDGDANGDAALDARAMPILPEAYVGLDLRHASIWMINAMMRRTAGSTEAFHPQAALSDADVLTVWRHDDGLTLIWRIATPRPGELLDAITSPDASHWRGLDERHLATRIDDDVVLLVDTAGDAAATLAAIEGWTALE